MSETEQTGDRIVAGIRMDKRTLKILKGIAEYLEVPFADLVEGMILHNFEGTCPFSPETVQKIEKLKAIYNLDTPAKDLLKLS
ncbi:MAG: hypothetical protein WCD42_04740 [Rhizomicrobium sp.]